MRQMYDSTTASDIPRDAQMVAGYIDGRFQWSDEDWALFPNAVKVRIAVFSSTNDGHLLDVEWGDARPDEVPGWLTMRRATGAEPSVYCNRSNLQAVKDACDAAGVRLSPIWLAAYGVGDQVLDGTVATQYANEAITGAHYDLSAVADFWPGVDKEGLVADLPQYAGQTAETITLKVNEVGVLEGAWVWPNGTRRAQTEKVVFRSPGRRPYTMYPKVDPDADETRELSADPALFIVDVIA